MSAIRIWMLILLSLVFIPACLPLFKHSGTEKNTMQTARIEPGKTLKKDALEWFGPPMIIAGLGEVVTLPDPTRLDKTYKGPRNLNTVEAAALFELFAAKHEFNDYHRVYYFHHAKSKLTTYFFLVVALYIDADTDFRYEAELKLDHKELAEHIMLVDLARNDIARVAEPGSRVVTELLIVEKYASVQHLVSNVKGTLAKGLDSLNAYLATMNMGTLTGAAKIEAMKLIRLFEKTKRGYYGGAVMYLTVDGQFDSCITIRSLQVKDHMAFVRVGAGIVHDSVPRTEFEETEHKANSCLRAIRGM